MRNILLLTTTWSNDYWNKSKEANYPNNKTTDLTNWNEFEDSCPYPALGIYKNGKKGDFSVREFKYLKITGMRSGENGIPYFKFVPITDSKIKSRDLLNEIPQDISRKLFSSIDYKLLSDTLNKINDFIPEEWRILIDDKKVSEPDTTNKTSNWKNI